MKKRYIIEDARKHLVEQINSIEGIERTAMQEKFSEKHKRAVCGLFQRIMMDIVRSIKMDCADGLGLMTVYQVYPGIQLIYNDFEATGCKWEGTLWAKYTGNQPLQREGVREANC